MADNSSSKTIEWYEARFIEVREQRDAEREQARVLREALNEIRHEAQMAMRVWDEAVEGTDLRQIVEVIERRAARALDGE